MDDITPCDCTYPWPGLFVTMSTEEVDGEGSESPGWSYVCRGADGIVSRTQIGYWM